MYVDFKEFVPEEVKCICNELKPYFISCVASNYFVIFVDVKLSCEREKFKL